MPVIKEISTLLNTGRSFAENSNFLQNIRDIFITKKDFTFTEADLVDDTYFFNAFSNLDIMPIHKVLDLIPENEEPVIYKSLQDYPYLERKGKYKHTLKFDFDLAFHQIIESYSGSDLYIIYCDSARHIIATEVSEGIYRGLTTDMIELNKPDIFTKGSQPAFSDLQIALRYPEEITESGKIFQVNWLPSEIDKAFINLRVEAIGSDYINFTVRFNNLNVTTIGTSDVTLTDENNGDINGFFLNQLGGVYQLQLSEPLITTGCLTINSNVYLGKARYTYRIVVEIVNNAVWGSGDNEIWGDGNNAVFTD